MAVLSITDWKSRAVVLREIAIGMAHSEERDAIVAAAKECDRLVVELRRRWRFD